MTDHDALARRIAERLAVNGFISVPGYCTAQEAMDVITKCIVFALREALPTSEDAEDALRDIACYVGSGGYNSDEVNVDQMAAKIKASFDDVHRRLQESRS